MPDINYAAEAFKVLKSIAKTSYGKGLNVDGMRHSPYSHILLTVNNAEAVFQNSSTGIDGNQLRQRFGLGDNDVLTLYSEDIIECLLTLAKKDYGKQEVDGAIIIDNNGRLLIEYGTREISSDLGKGRRGRKAGGMGRRAMQRASTLPDVSGLMFSDNTFEVLHYKGGKRVKSFKPKR